MKGDDGRNWLAEDVLASAKYRTVSPALVRPRRGGVGQRSKRKDALKAVRTGCTRSPQPTWTLRRSMTPGWKT